MNKKLIKNLHDGIILDFNSNFKENLKYLKLINVVLDNFDNELIYIFSELRPKEIKYHKTKLFKKYEVTTQNFIYFKIDIDRFMIELSEDVTQNYAFDTFKQILKDIQEEEKKREVVFFKKEVFKEIIDTIKNKIFFDETVNQKLKSIRI